MIRHEGDSAPPILTQIEEIWKIDWFWKYWLDQIIRDFELWSDQIEQKFVHSHAKQSFKATSCWVCQQIGHTNQRIL